MLLQHTYRYFRLYPADPYYLKLWVILTVYAVVHDSSSTQDFNPSCLYSTLQTITVVLTMHTSYFYTITNYFNPAVIIRSRDVWSASIVPVFGAISNLLSESFFARRVFKIGPQYRIIVVSAMTMILAATGFFLAVSAQAFQVHNLLESAARGSWLPTTGSALLLGGDLQLTSVLVYVLRRNRRGVKRTDSMIDILVVYAISSGLLICIFNVLSMILSLVFPDNIIYTAAALISQQVYTNSFVIALNTRRFVVSQGDLDASGVSAAVVRKTGQHSGSPANAVELPSMAFASGPSQSLILDAGEKGRLDEARDTVTTVDIGQDNGRNSSDNGQDSDRTSSDPSTAV
ncbi:hypothetical protein C8Q80DRAFT_1190933 [Daedaleopsis nitida]|nr:hypothetical protein C8Q80DRAFT_1190933 [Daedaleopsis nitida]